jgi:hypothetical protein
MVSEEIGLPADDQAPSLARAFVTNTLEAWKITGSREEIMLATSELVANAVLHGGEPVTVHLSSLNGCVRLEVGDGSNTVPFAPAGNTDSFGIDLVSKFCTRWGVTIHRPGKTVWCECPAEPRTGHRQVPE